MIMLEELGGRGRDKESFAEVIGDVVQDYLEEIPAVEIIGVLETAKACVIKQAVDELRDEG